MLALLVGLSLWSVPSPVLAVPQVLHPALLKVCICESGQGTGKPQQFDIKTGNVLRGKVNPKDVGMCQISETYHLAAATKLGFDIYTEQGNIGYANWLYQEEGLAPWKYSAACWRD